MKSLYKQIHHYGSYYYSTKIRSVPIDYYAILQVSAGATKHDIKKQFYRLSLLYHPDRQQTAVGAEAKMKFHQISEAYAVLCDAQKRKTYDLTRAASSEVSSVREAQKSPFSQNSSNFKSSSPGAEMFDKQPHRPYVFYSAREHFMGHYGRSTSRKRREEAWKQYMNRGETESKDAMITLIKLVSWLAIPIIYAFFKLGD